MHIFVKAPERRFNSFIFSQLLNIFEFYVSELLKPYRLVNYRRRGKLLYLKVKKKETKKATN